MRNLRIVLVAVAVAVTTLVGVQPARADVITCSGVARMTTPRMYHPNFGIIGSGAWTMTMLTGNCTPAATMTAYGTVAGTCALAFGTGTVDDHDFTFVWFMGMMLWSGDAVGSWQTVTAVHMGHSCTSGAAEWYAAGSMTTTA